MVLKLNGFSVAVDFEKGEISSLVIAGKERLAGREPLFRFRLRDREGQMVELTALDAANCKQTEDGAIYSGFPLLGRAATEAVRRSW